MTSPRPGISTTPQHPPRISQDAFLGVVWGGFTLATIFVSFRSVLRLKKFRRFFIDDAFVLTGWTIICSTSILWQIVAKDMYYQAKVVQSQQLPPPDFYPRTERFLKSSAAIVFLFYTTLWSVKLSFLFFFRRLYTDIGRWNIFWWVIMGVTMASYFACIGDIEYNCLVKPIIEMATHCLGPDSVRFQRSTLVANCVLDVVTDILITCIPFTMLWKVRISPRRKFALGIVFSVTVITMTFAIVRVAILSSSGTGDMTWLYHWSNIECYTAMIVSSLGSFRSLFASQDSIKTPPPEDSPPTIGSPLRRKLNSFAHIIDASLLSSRNKSSYGTETLNSEAGMVERGSSVSNGEDPYIELEDSQRTAKTPQEKVGHR